MARTPSRFVKALTAEDQEVLRYLRDDGETRRIRQRAHAVLLSHDGKTVNELAKIFGVTRDTVRDWFDRWEHEGLLGLGDAARSGKPPILSAAEQTKAVELLTANPRSTKQVLQEIQATMGKTISSVTLRRIAHRSKLRWKRMRRSARPQRDEAEFREAQADIREFQEFHRADELDLYYFDEAGFSLQPSVPYGWQPEGETLEIPSRRSQQLNVLGFLSLSSFLVPFTIEGTIDAEVVLACFEAFSKTVKRLSVVVIDNASAHTSKRFVECRDRWETKGLFLYYLPPHSPELNLIEILWRMIKYHWLPLSAYQDFRSLVEHVHEVLAQVGSRHIINFAAMDG
jgi:transposase